MSAARIFAARFREKNLRRVYADKIRESKSIGIDRMRPENLNKTLNSELAIVVRKVAIGSYSFTAYKQKLISKGADQCPRVLSIPTARDRIVLRALCQVLQDVFPEAMPEIPQIKIEALKVALNSGTFHEFVRLDLRNFYGSIAHAELIKALKKRVRKRQILDLVTSAIETPTIRDGSPSAGVARNLLGVPQGLSISNQLAEITIQQIDNELTMRPDIAYFRYVDDILILTATGQSHPVAEQALQMLRDHQFIPHDPAIPNSKSKFGSLNESFSFLGYQITGNRVSVKAQSVIALEASLAAILTNYRYRVGQAQTPVARDNAIRICEWRLNLKITGCISDGVRRGWLFYFSQINDTGCLRTLQHTLTTLIERFGATSVIRPKSFIKAFYEGRRKDTELHKYIPNFDLMDVAEMRDYLSMYLGRSRVTSLSDKTVERMFKKRIRHAVKELEADLSGLS